MKKLLLSLMLCSGIACASEIVSLRIPSTATTNGANVSASVPVTGFIEGINVQCSNATNGAVSVNLFLNTESGRTIFSKTAQSGTETYYTIRKYSVDQNAAATNVPVRDYVVNSKLSLIASNSTFASIVTAVDVIVSKE